VEVEVLVGRIGAAHQPVPHRRSPIAGHLRAFAMVVRAEMEPGDAKLAP
jgi:hypothetical protein